MIFFGKKARVAYRFTGWLLALGWLTVCGACASPPAPAIPTPTLATVALALPSATPASIPSATSLPAPTATATVTVTPTITVTPSEACPAANPVCYLTGHFWLQNPAPETVTRSIERSYPYGGTQNNTREVHHGVEFYNAQGTPVLAAAAGEVVFAGADQLTLIGPLTGFYGNVIVLRHTMGGETFFTLYGHLYRVGVSVGQQVAAGEQIGEVGATGAAIGSHLHFEVRRGTNDYKSTRNPELWLVPLDATGVLAGRLVDEAGNPIRGRINIQRMENGVLNPLSVGSSATYPQETINPDDLWQESFVFGGLPVGEVRLSLVHHGMVYEQVVKIEAGRLTFVNFVVR